MRSARAASSSQPASKRRKPKRSFNAAPPNRSSLGPRQARQGPFAIDPATGPSWHPVLVRSASYDLVAAVLVVLDRAALAGARGKWEAQQIALRHVVSLTDQLSPTSAWSGYGRVLWVLHVWRCGDADRALAALRCVDTAASDDATAVIGSKSDAGFAAARWDDQWQSEPSLETGSCAAWVHHHAGHVVRARELASEMTCRLPEDGGAWAALAGVLYAQARYRDAKVAVCTALKRGYDPDEGQQLLNQVQQALGVG